VKSITSWQTTTHPSQPTYLRPEVETLFTLQSLIGWDQILKGRFSKAWCPLISADTQAATQWISYTIKIFWHSWYDIWKYRCEMNHGYSPESKCSCQKSRLAPQVQQLYDEIDNIDPSNSYIFKHSMDALLAQHSTYIENWI
jgi:hypothetical protein